MNQYLAQIADKLPDWLWNLLVILFSILIGMLIQAILVPIVKKQSTSSTSYSIIRSSIRHLNQLFAFFIPLLIFNFLLPLTNFNKAIFQILDRITEVAITICFAITLIKILRIFEDYLYHRFDYTKADNLKERKIRTQLVFIRKLLISIIIIVTLSIILLSFESMRKIGAGLLTGVGIGGIIIGFAAQKSLGNLLAGFQIAFTQPLRMDDVLVVEGEWGKVEEINLTYVVLNIWDKRRLVLPINYFIEKPFQNWTRTTSEILGTVFLYVDFSVPIGPLRKKFTELLQQNSLWDGKVNVVQVTDLREQTMEIRFLMSCRNSGEAFDLRCYIREEMTTFIQQSFPKSLSKIRLAIEEKSTP